MEELEKKLDESLEIALAMHDLGYPVTFFDKAGRVVEKGEIGYFPNILLVGCFHRWTVRDILTILEESLRQSENQTLKL